MMCDRFCQLHDILVGELCDPPQREPFPPWFYDLAAEGLMTVDDNGVHFATGVHFWRPR